MLTTHFLSSAEVKNEWIYASTPPLSFNGGFLVIFIHFVKVYEGNKEHEWAAWSWYYCVWSVGMEGSHSGLVKKCEKKVKQVNDKIKGLKNNFCTLKIRVYNKIIFSGNFLSVWNVVASSGRKT